MKINFEFTAHQAELERYGSERITAEAKTRFARDLAEKFLPLEDLQVDNTGSPVVKGEYYLFSRETIMSIVGGMEALRRSNPNSDHLLLNELLSKLRDPYEL